MRLYYSNYLICIVSFFLSLLGKNSCVDLATILLPDQQEKWLTVMNGH